MKNKYTEEYMIYKFIPDLIALDSKKDHDETYGFIWDIFNECFWNNDFYIINYILETLEPKDLTIDASVAILGFSGCARQYLFNRDKYFNKAIEYLNSNFNEEEIKYYMTCFNPIK